MRLFGKNRKKVGVVIVSAGNAVRMNGIDKPFIDVGGLPVIIRTMIAFEESEMVDSVVLVCREDTVSRMIDLSRQYGITKLATITVGGKTRQESVFKGVEALPSDIDYIAVHDGARPFVSVDVIERCICDAMEFTAAAAGIKAKDTIKMVGHDGFIMSTPPREYLYITQTPQIFEKSLYLRAMDKAKEEQKDFTDDCQLVENLGEKVYMTESEYVNIKLTTPEDIAIAQIIADGLEY